MNWLWLQQLGLFPAEVRLIAAIAGSVEVGRPVGAAVEGRFRRRQVELPIGPRLARIGK